MNRRNSKILDFIKSEQTNPDRSPNSTTLNRDARYIPCRFSRDDSLASLYRIKSNQKLEKDGSNFLQSLEKAIFDNSDNYTQSILNFRKANKSRGVNATLNEKALSVSEKSKDVSPYRILEMPNLQVFCFKKHIDWGFNDLISLYMNGQLYTYNEATKETVAHHLDEFELSVLKICENADFELLANSEGGVKLFDINTQKIVSSSHPNYASPIDIRWISPLVGIVFFKNGFIRNYDIRTDLKKNEVLFTNHYGINCADYSRHNQNIAIGTKSGKVICTDMRKLKESPIIVNSHTSGVKSIAFNPFRPSVVLSGGSYKDRRIHALNIYTKSKIKSLKTGSQANDIKFLPRVESFVVAHNHGKPDYALSVYNRHFKLIEKIDKRKSNDDDNINTINIALSPKEDKILATYESRVAKFWEMNFEGKGSRKNSNMLELR